MSDSPSNDSVPHVILLPREWGGGHDDPAMEVFASAEAAIAHGNEYIAEWQHWIVGRVEIVHDHPSVGLDD